jgi:ribosomal protein S18 acetylase RimI-like enzyme
MRHVEPPTRRKGAAMSLQSMHTRRAEKRRLLEELEERALNQVASCELLMSAALAGERELLLDAIQSDILWYEALERSVPRIRLYTMYENPTAAWRLYQELGFRRVAEFPRWRKPLVR